MTDWVPCLSSLLSSSAQQHFCCWIRNSVCQQKTASRLLKKRCNDTSPLSDWKCRALCLPIWSTLAQSGGYSDQSGQLDEIVGRHRQGELEVELPNAT